MSFIDAIKDTFYALENRENAHWMRQYMRNKFCRSSPIHAPLKTGGFEAFILIAYFFKTASS